ncbi:hypothetical protein DFR59_10648 [Falsibacillus pallidus]|uniref:Uncharacterized protein n=1 Tax=Falsibacillus pallidus TaxID=493781 RepID=A0A370GFJ9_9BACI|nr:hypothetical protein DFR59_10648 [Falsibacillus pallidus]
MSRSQQARKIRRHLSGNPSPDRLYARKMKGYAQESVLYARKPFSYAPAQVANAPNPYSYAPLAICHPPNTPQSICTDILRQKSGGDTRHLHASPYQKKTFPTKERLFDYNKLSFHDIHIFCFDKSKAVVEVDPVIFFLAVDHLMDAIRV